MMNDRLKESQLLLGLLAVLMLVTSVVLFAQQIPPTSSGISKGLTEGARPQDSFVPSYITHNPITITSNVDFVSQGFSGNGTAEDPYVIEGYNVTTTGVCISIQSTDAYFVIRDCLLTGGSSGKGVRLDGVDHGEIRNSTIEGNFHGVCLSFSSNNTVMNNTISGNKEGVLIESSSDTTVVNNTISGSDYYGVYLDSSSNNTVVNNTISGNDSGGVRFYSSSNNTVVNNTIEGNDHGVWFSESPDNTLTSNIFLNNGFYIYGNGVEKWRHTITTDNLVNGKSLGYFWNWTSGIIDGTQYGQVILANCTGVTVENGVFNNATMGIALGYSSYCSLINNTLSGNDHGVPIIFSSNNTVMNNTISGNDHGVSIASSLDNTVVNNTISGSNYGVYVASSSNNTVMNNTISGNNNGVFLAAFSNNIVNNTISRNDLGVHLYYSSNNTLVNNTISGNFWWGMYIDSSSDNNLIYLNVIADNDNGNAQDYGANNHWNTTETGNYWSDYSGTGVYQVPGSADSIDYYPFMYPADTTPPMIDHPEDMDYEEGTTGHSITWTSSDEHPSHYVVYRNGTEVVSASWDGNSITVEVDGLSVGVYNYTVAAYDTSGNCASDTILIIVSPQTTTSTTTTTPDEPRTFDYTTIIIVVSAGAMLIIIIIIIVKKRGG